MAFKEEFEKYLEEELKFECVDFLNYKKHKEVLLDGWFDKKNLKMIIAEMERIDNE